MSSFNRNERNGNDYGYEFVMDFTIEIITAAALAKFPQISSLFSLYDLLIAFGRWRRLELRKHCQSIIVSFVQAAR